MGVKRMNGPLHCFSVLPHTFLYLRGITKGCDAIPLLRPRRCEIIDSVTKNAESFLETG